MKSETPFHVRQSTDAHEPKVDFPGSHVGSPLLQDGSPDRNSCYRLSTPPFLLHRR